MLHVADILFLTFHTLLIIFNLFGWIYSRTRKWNLAALLITAGSWLFLGMIVGSPGYCPLTDWHFRVLEGLGRTGLPNSYIKYLADRLTGLSFDTALVDAVTLWGLVIALLASTVLNTRDYLTRRRKTPSAGTT